jgi:hypothetical protein
MVVSMPNEALRTNDEQDLSNVLGIESYDFGITKYSLIFMAYWKESVKRWKILVLSHRNGRGNNTGEFII